MPQCRFCLEDAEEDQLVAPCNCDGSHKFVHAECLAECQFESGRGHHLK
mgnify:CR=1 FL=1